MKRPLASAAENAFVLSGLSSGYQVTDKKIPEGKCGEGTCGGAGNMGADGIALYTGHLSSCSDDRHLYDLLPIPCTEEAAKYVPRAGHSGTPHRDENASFYGATPIAEKDARVHPRRAGRGRCDLLPDLRTRGAILGVAV